MRAASKSRGVSKIPVRRVLWFCACNLLAATLAAQCTNPTQVPNGTYTSGDHSATDNNALSASSFAISGSATATLVAGNCIQLLPNLHASAIGATVPTTFHYTSRRVKLAALGMLSSSLLVAGSGGSLTGSVGDDSGHPVAGARVLISYAPSIKPPVPAPPVMTGPLAAMITAHANGTFHADSLAPGQHMACAEASTPGYLDPCHWSASAPNSVSAGQTTSGVKIAMARGSVLRVHVDDPQQLLKPVVGPVDLDFEVHVVTSKGVHYSAPIQSSTAVGRDHVITIPFDSPVSLRVLSAHFTVNDQLGKSFAPAGTSVSVPAGTSPAAIGVTVTGKK